MKTVLVVEDDKKIAKTLEIRLRSMGYLPLMAYDAVMGIQSAVKDKPDLVIMDISMPGGDGLSVFETMNELVDTSNIPVIFITASKKLSYRERAADLGAAGYFEKPYDSDRLLGRIEQIL